MKAIDFNISRLRAASSFQLREIRGDIFESRTVKPQHASIVRETMQRPKRLRMYEAAGVSRSNGTADFGVDISSGNAEVLNSFIAASTRARKLERDNPYAWRGLQLFQNNVCGPEPFKLTLKIGKTVNGRFVKEKDTIAKIKKWWAKEGRPENYTVRKNQSRSSAYWQAITACIRDGGILWRKFPLYPGNDTRFGIKPLEIDHLDHWLCRPAFGTANEIQFGIEKDAYGAPVAYHILTRHPGDVFAFSYSPRYRERIPANEIIHFQDIITRAGQDKAMPRFCSVITGLHRLDQYDIAEMNAAVLAACYSGFLVRKNQQGTEFQGDTQTEDGEKEIRVEPGTLYELDSSQEFQAWNPQHPVEAYPEFTNQNIRRCAVGLGLSHFSLSENYEGISYASGRMSLLENRREYKKLQQHMKEGLVVPEFEARLRAGLLSGTLDLPVSRYREICDAADFICTRWDWVDPLKDGQANILAINAGLDSRQRVIAESERGGDSESVDAEQAEDNDSAKAHDLVYSSAEPDIEKEPSESPDASAPAKTAVQAPRGKRLNGFVRNGHR
jgi:lambda family phage portal protein